MIEYNVFFTERELNVINGTVYSSSGSNREFKAYIDPEAFIKKAYPRYRLLGETKSGAVQFFVLHKTESVGNIITESIATIGFVAYK